MRICEGWDERPGLERVASETTVVWRSVCTPSDETSTHATAFNVQARTSSHCLDPQPSHRAWTPYPGDYTPHSTRFPLFTTSSSFSEALGIDGFLLTVHVCIIGIGTAFSTCIYAFPVLSHCHYLSYPRISTQAS
jgi:hypothetical protein